MATESMAEKIARLERENAALRVKAESRNAVTFHVSRGGKAKDGTVYEGKGGIMVRGFGRNPVTLYVEQWDRFLEHVDEFKEFITANREECARINAAYRAKHGKDE